MRPALLEQVLTLVAALLFAYGFFGTGYWLFPGGLLFDVVGALSGEPSQGPVGRLHHDAATVERLFADWRRTAGIGLTIAALFAGPMLGSGKTFGRMMAIIAFLGIIVFHGRRLHSVGLVSWFDADPMACAGDLVLVVVSLVCLITVFALHREVVARSERNPGDYHVS